MNIAEKNMPTHIADGCLYHASVALGKPINLKSSRSDGSERLFFVVLKTCKFADFDIR